MQVPEDSASINRSRVAIANKNTTDEALLERKSTQNLEEKLLENGRKLTYRYYDIFDNFEQDPEWYLIIEALELHIRPGDYDTSAAALNFTWELVSYD